MMTIKDVLYLNMNIFIVLFYLPEVQPLQKSQTHIILLDQKINKHIKDSMSSCFILYIKDY